MRTIVTESMKIGLGGNYFLRKGGAPVESTDGAGRHNVGFYPTGDDTKNFLPYNQASTYRGGRGHFLGLNPRINIRRKVMPTDSAITEAIQETSPVVIANTSCRQR